MPCRYFMARFPRYGAAESVMRFPLTIVLLVLAAASGDAGASSLIVLEQMKSPVGPSIVALRARPSSVSSEGTGSAAWRSIIAFGEAVPAVSHEKLSSIGTNPAAPRKGPFVTPMVIRGGIVGDAFLRSAPVPVAEPRQAAAGQEPASSRTEAEAPPVGPSADSELNLQ